MEEWPEAKRRRRGYVLADEDWHEGVIGIVASRLVERFNRPVVLIAGTDGEWKGSGRSTSAFDLHGGLAACAGHLERFGGHRAAAGLSIKPENVEAFATRSPRTPTSTWPTRICSRLPGRRSRRRRRADTRSCEELRRLAPFGLGNPGVTLLLPGCELRELGAVGEGKHLRFRVNERGRDAGSAIAFGIGRQLDRYRREGRYDVVFRLEENHWNGTVAPQLVVRRIFDAADRAYEELRAGSRSSGSPEASARRRRARSSPSSSSTRRPARRQLYESERFRALLEEPASTRGLAA